MNLRLLPSAFWNAIWKMFGSPGPGAALRSGPLFQPPGRVAVRRSDFPRIRSLDTNFETAWIRCAQADESAYRN